MFFSSVNRFSRFKELLSSRNFLPVFMVCGLLTTSISSNLLKNRRYIITDGVNTTNIVSFCKGIGNILNKANIKINDNDRVLIDDVDALTTNINIKRAIPVTVIVDNVEHNLDLPEGSTVEDAINNLKISLGSEDVLNMPKDSVINNETKIVIDRVFYKTSSFIEDIPFTVEKKETNSLPRGTTKIDKEGILGKKEITVKEKFINGNLNSSERFESIKVEPQYQIELIGTKVPDKNKIIIRKNIRHEPQNNLKSVPAMGTFVDSSGKTVAYKAVHHGVCTAYCDGKIGAMGTLVKAGEDIAVNPAVIPLGSKVYIPGYGYAKATDTGGAMLRRKNPVLADLRMRNEQECRRHGRRNMTIYVLA